MSRPRIRTVFLSSTGRDLREHREAVYAAIQRLDGWKCIRMEDFGARDSAPLALCLEHVAACDLFVGLTGHFYGSSPPGDKTSFTEHEYRKAERLDKPRLMFVASPDLPMPAKLRESDANHKRQKKFRDSISSGQVVQFFEKPEILAARVVEAIRNWERTSPEAGEAGEEPRPGKIFENVPPRDLNFTGRVADLERLHRLLTGAGRPAAITQAAIRGLGGIGKTTLAIEYAHRYQDAYAGIWWAPAQDRAVLIASLAGLAARLDRRLAQEPDLEKAARAGLARLGGSAIPFLLIYDNVESPDTLPGLVPSAGARVLLTTRWSDWGGRAAELELDVLGDEAAADFLQKRAGRTDGPGAARLAAALGCLPLALDHAGAYCRLTGESFDAYSGSVDSRIVRAPKGAAYPQSIAATFGLAVEKATAETPAAEHLLGFFAVLAPERIPLDLVSPEIMEEEKRSDALMALAAVSLIEHTPLDNGEPAVTLHRMVRAAMRARLEAAGEMASTQERVTQYLADAFPGDAYREPKAWPRCATLLSHVLALREHARYRTSAKLAEILNVAASYLHGRAAYSEAEPLYREAIEIGEKTLGRQHPYVSTWLNNLASLLRETGRYTEAEPLYREAIEIDEQVFGRKHPEVAIDLNNLAGLLRATGRYTEAEPLYREAIEIGEKTLGRQHPDVAVWLNNLAHLLRDTGRHAEAEPLYREAIEIGEKTLGRQHPNVIDIVRNLAKFLDQIGRGAEATALRARYSLPGNKPE